MITPVVSTISSSESGYWRILVDPMPSDSLDSVQDVTFFRNIITSINSLSTTDPFGPGVATLFFPGITLLDTPGTGDLSWLVPEANVDICWMSPQTANVNPTKDDVLYRWEGYFVSFEYGEDDAGSNLTITCNGALKQMDNFLAKPEYLTQPISYENAISRQFELNRYPSSRLSPSLSFESSVPYWFKTFPDHIYSKAEYSAKTSSLSANTTIESTYEPDGLVDGQVWSGLLTRSTGNFEPVLTGYIQTLLSSMHTQRGTFSLLLAPGRIPYFKHRTRLNTPTADTLVVDLLWPGIKMSVTKDYSQEVNVVYGSGKSLSGNTFNNIKFNANASEVTFEPFAYNETNYPSVKSNSKFNKSAMAKEVSLTFYDGLTAESAKVVAEKQLEMFVDPGMTASLTLNTDPTLLDGTGVARQTLTAGMSVLVKGLFGNRQGTLFHVTEHSYNGEDNSVSLTLDSKFRDQLTVQEVRKRGKDALVVSRMLQVGKYAPAINDLLYPWSVNNQDSVEPASGFIPSSSTVSIWNRALKDKVDANNFPWTSITAHTPPSANPKSDFYASIKGPATVTNSDKNWSKPIPVILSANGGIMASQFAAYKDDGSIYKVPFHVSLWYEDTISTTAMPGIPAPTNAAKTRFKKVSLSIGVKPANDTRRKVTATFSVPHGMKKGSSFIIAGGTNKIPKNFTYSVDSRLDSKKITFWVPEDATSTESTSSTATVTIDVISTATTWSENNTGFSYTFGQHYPFFAQAWENKLPTGSNVIDKAVTSTNTPIIAWGTYYEKAGYWPNSSSETLEPTGQFQDTTNYTYDFTSQSVGVIANDTPENNQKLEVYTRKAPARITAYAMFYCDQEWDSASRTLVPRASSVNFLGRLYRQPPGQ